MLKLLYLKFFAFWNRGAYPSDQKERDRIKAFILGAGVPPNVRNGRVKVGISDGK